MNTSTIVRLLLAALLAPPAVVPLVWLAQGHLQRRARRLLRRGALAGATRAARRLLWLEGIKLRALRLVSCLTFDRHGTERRLFRLGVTGPAARAAGILL